MRGCLTRSPDHRRPPAIRTTVACALAALVAIGGGPAQAQSPAREGELFTLAAHFYRQGQYYRAVGALEELRLFTADEALKVRAGLLVALSYHQGLQIREAVAVYDQLLASAKLSGAAAGLTRLSRILARAEGERRGILASPPPDLIAEVRPLVDDAEPIVASEARYQLVRLNLADGDHDAAQTAADAFLDLCAVRSPIACPHAVQLRTALDLPGPRHRSPLAAAALSAVLPGLGSVYTEHHVDALYYFGLTAGSGLMAWDVYQPGQTLGGQRPTFYVLGSLATVFYLSSIVQGWLGAKRLQEVERWQYRRDVLRVTERPSPLEAVVLGGSATR